VRDRAFESWSRGRSVGQCLNLKSAAVDKHGGAPTYRSMDLRQPSRLIPIAIFIGAAIALALYLANHLAIHATIMGVIGAALVFFVFRRRRNAQG
jgi:hypothetical protein